MLFLNIRFRQNRHISVLDFGCIRLDLLITLHSDFSISGLYSDVNKPNRCNLLIFNSPVFCSMWEFCRFHSKIWHILSLWLPVTDERMSTEYFCLRKVWLGSTSHSYMTSDVKQEINQKAFTLPHSFLCCLI